ncbi:MAG: response regulator transcription factor [Planctomycetota bacterium]
MSKTILLADDDIDFRTQLELQLTAAGFEVVSAAGQAEAEQLLQTVTPDLAIVDLMMENQDGGFALCYHIKRKDAGIPVILVTAVANETGLEFDAATDEERSWIKADAMLAKPIRFEQLRKEMDRLMTAEKA